MRRRIVELACNTLKGDGRKVVLLDLRDRVPDR